MKLSTYCNALALVLFTTEQTITGFSMLPPSTTCRTTPYSRTTTVVYGILDDMADSISSSDDNDKNSNIIMGQEDKYESLFDELIFAAGDTKTHIADRLEACSDADFLQWLEWNMEEADDEEEEGALRELLEMIDQVMTEENEKTTTAAAALMENNKKMELETAEAAKKVELMDEVKTAVEVATTTGMSPADILKKARAIMTAEGAEDEVPTDYNFMRDVKAERGLGGFNNKGQMRVGGS